MSNRNFDSRTIILRLQEKNRARNLYLNNVYGRAIINNPQTSSGDASRINTYHDGSETMYYRGLLDGRKTIDIGGTVNIPPFPPQPTGPGGPFIVSVIPGIQLLTVNFTPGSDGGFSIINYEYSIDGGVTFTSAGTTSSPIVITGLANGQTCSVVIRAISTIGPGANSNTVVATTISAPSAPTITSINPGNTILSVNFTPGFDGGSPITSYEYSINGGGSFVAAIETSSPISITGLTNGTSYNVIIRALNIYFPIVGPGANSNTVTATPRTVPSAPTITSITPGNTILTVNYTPGFDGGSPVTDYRYSTDNGASFSGPNAITSPIVITGLINGTSYDVIIQLENAAGTSANSNMITATPRTVPSAPTITSIDSGNGQLSVLYTPGFDGGSPITNYEYSIDGGGFISAGLLSPIVISTGVINGTTYNIVIRALNIAGNGAPSNIVSATPYANGWVTNIGGAGADDGRSITRSIDGNIYGIGNFTSPSTFINNYSTLSSGIILTSTFGRLIGNVLNADAYIVKYTSSGQALWATNIGGAVIDNGIGITTDMNGNVYTTGFFTTSSFVNSFSTLSIVGTSSFIITSTFGRLNAIGTDAYIAKYNSTGQALWATNIGGAVNDQGLGITTDMNGNSYTTGFFRTSTFVNSFSTLSIVGTSSFIITSTFGRLVGLGSDDVFIAKYNSTGQALWATNIGGNFGDDNGISIVSDSFGNTYTTGYFTISSFVNSFSTISTSGTSSFIITSTFGRLVGLAINDMFIAKYNSTGQAEWATNIGGAGTSFNRGNSVTYDIFGNIYVTGIYSNTFINSFSTISTSGTSSFIITSTFGRLLGSGSDDVFITKYNPSGQVQWATNIGGATNDNGLGITTDMNGNVYVTGAFVTSSFINSFSTLSTAGTSTIIVRSTFGRLLATGANDAFIVKYTSSGQVQWATNVGGIGNDVGRSITTDMNGSIYITGQISTFAFINNYSTVSSGIIITSTIGRISTVGATTDAFIVKYNGDGKCIL